ncbi:T9SS type B sorting domain-containing protein [Maribacter sp. MAR_2009_72]|uniref:T9SS type B sorting domain-containing protein n=1 Tax=Maribacter sp. MAR_2009_72 TaxID=1250050 RepID=UPI0011997DB2|nr:T9SS type B sorting domain-containing protein [Maribacter sp. MAR_2009_72]TVZ17207.1 gliding motility-associated-like protein [Maribacter sp. MAR_2009_72]
MKTKQDLELSRILAMPLFFLMLCMSSLCIAQECPKLLSPLDGATQVDVNTTINWEPITGVPGYILSIGTTPGGTELLNEKNVGSSTTYTPPLGLPENTEVYVTISLFFFNRPTVVCETQRFTTGPLTEIPQCTTLQLPLNNANNVNPATNILWAASPNATGYRISIGTTMNGRDIIDNLDVANALTYNPVNDFPAETTLYITILPYNRLGTAINCTTFNFITAPEAQLPNCSSLITPLDGETNVPLSPFLEWTPVENATGFRITIGTSPFDSNILDNAIFYKTSTVIIDFEPNRTFFVTITPFNQAGDALGCPQETFSTLIGCGPYYDMVSGELTVLNPEFTLPEKIALCSNTSNKTITAPINADGYRWYKVEENGRETLLSTTKEIVILEEGNYALEAFNIINDANNTFECATTTYFEVEISVQPTIKDVVVTQQANSLSYEIMTDNVGDYEYSLDNEQGPYQDINLFSGQSLVTHIVYVRDKNGCGTASRILEYDPTINGFPDFFTPNGDGINDFWNYLPVLELDNDKIATVHIFDKYGNLIFIFNSDSNGWDGSYNGKQLPEADYWFKAQMFSNKIFKGHFSLKR